jgi:hypothetical protein
MLCAFSPVVIIFQALYMFMTRSDDALYLQLYTVGSRFFVCVYKIYIWVTLLINFGGRKNFLHTNKWIFPRGLRRNSSTLS